MVRSLSAFLVALFAGWLLVGSTTTASAHYRGHHGWGHHGWGHHGGCCGPIRPTYVYKTVHKVNHVTHYRDVSRTRYVYRTHRIIHVTRVQPVIYIHNVTRVHHRTVGLVRKVYQHRTEYLPPRRIVTARVINTYDCRCTYRCHR